MNELTGNDSFGNYSLHGIDELVLPEPVSWMPQTLAWYVFAAVCLLMTVIMMYRLVLRWWNNKYRRVALETIKTLECNRALASNPCELMRVLKATALVSFPRVEVAQLSGQAWLEFLNEHCSAVDFCGETGRWLLRVNYSQIEEAIDQDRYDKAIKLVKVWIKKHHATSFGNA